MMDDVEGLDALYSIGMDGAGDTEAQSVVTDFLDYTEYLPSDIIRSFTLIRQLDQAYEHITARVHERTKQYGKLRQMPVADRPSAQELRRQISRALDLATNFREASLAEATRIRNAVHKHAARLKLIKSKLKALPMPPSGQHSSVTLASPKISRSSKGQAAPKLNGHLAENKTHAGRLLVPDDSVVVNEPETKQAVLSAEEANQLPRPPSLPALQQEPNHEHVHVNLHVHLHGPDGDLDIQQEPVPMPDPLPGSGLEYKQLPVKVSQVSDHGRARAESFKPLKSRQTANEQWPNNEDACESEQEQGREHHKMLSLSASDALARLTPPPEDAPRGSKYRPWLKLTDWELARIRKQMKKNVTWLPSEAMHRRVLEDDERGPDAWLRAKSHAEANGRLFLDQEPEIREQSCVANDLPCLPSATSAPFPVPVPVPVPAPLSARLSARAPTPALTPASASASTFVDAPTQDTISNRFKCASKQHEKERQLLEAALQSTATNPADVPAASIEIFVLSEKEEGNSRPQTRQATRGAMQLDEINRVATRLSIDMRNVFTSPAPFTPIHVSDAPMLDTTRPARKRKLASAVRDANEHTKVATSKQGVTTLPSSLIQEAKKQKLDESSAKPRAITPQEAMSLEPNTATPSVIFLPEGPSSPMSDLSELDTKVESIETQHELDHQPVVPESILIQSTALRTRSSCTSVDPRASSSTLTSPNLAVLELPTAPSSSRASLRTRQSTTATKAASAEPPPSRREARELRRLSINEEITPAAQKQPAPRSTRSTGTAGRRRPPPGLVTSEDNGKSKVSMGRRKAKPDKRSAAPKKSNAAPARKDSSATAAAPAPSVSDKHVGDTNNNNHHHQTNSHSTHSSHNNPSKPNDDDDDNEAYDTDEPIYCICDDVSWGTMIACENDKCDKEWFHLDCIGLAEIPPRRSKWYCPLCQQKLHVDVKGNAQPEPVSTTRRR